MTLSSGMTLERLADVLPPSLLPSIASCDGDRTWRRRYRAARTAFPATSSSLSPDHTHTTPRHVINPAERPLQGAVSPADRQEASQQNEREGGAGGLSGEQRRASCPLPCSLASQEPEAINV